MRIDQSAGFASDLLRQVERGYLVPAAFQRAYVWKKANVLALCDSIISGFPIGGFLIWRPGQEADISRAGRGRLGPIPVQQTDSRGVGLLLDGQNRLASLAWMSFVGDLSLQNLTELSRDERETWCSGESLVLDFDTQSIRFVPTDESRLGLRLPISSVVSQDVGAVNREALARWDTDWKGFSEKDKDGLIALFDRVSRQFSSARISDTVICGGSVEEARHAFLRICQVGVPMSTEDFDAAVQWKEVKI